ncbi:MFS transporter [Streptacidiphilus sp. P02-A3a]|uniref:MFS transporter n=1 Tax=Streptacidiphilus sp. P02-A3a TaxID=2704468 RepID=UPI0015FB629F|nr:MFS transporter [Streptacidiphilus sp. P02-A3a]QMU73034.1 MFS transporter [Streptacidiphilus sp. P02-A3a]
MQLMVVLDGTIVTVALPTVQNSLGFSQSGLAWVMNAYLLAFAGLLLLSGRLGDLLGGRRVFLAGLVLFTSASLLCGVADSRGLLIAGRFAQGAGGALASAVILGMIVRLYPEPTGQARAMGIYSFVSAGGAAVGLIAGGVITQTLGWHWAFLVNVPIGVAALVCAVRVLAADRGIGLGEGADVLGAVLVTAGLSLCVYAIVQSGQSGVGPGRTLGCGAAALALLAGFVVRQATAARPMLPLRLFAKRQTTGANLVVVLVFAAGFGFQFLNALYLQHILGFSSMRTGLAFLPGPVVIGVVSLFLSAGLNTRFGTRAVLLTGLAAIAVSLALLSRAPVGGHYATDILPTLLLMGLGMGLAIPAVMMLAMSGAEPGDAGLASGLNSTAQQAGAAVGLAVLATLAVRRTDARLSHGVPGIQALRDGYSLSFLASAGFVCAAFLVALVVLKPATRAPARPADIRESVAADQR